MVSPPAAPIERSHLTFVYLRPFCRRDSLLPLRLLDTLGYNNPIYILAEILIIAVIEIFLRHQLRAKSRNLATMSDVSLADILEKLQGLEQDSGNLDTNLAIVRISEPIFSPDANSAPTPSKRNSDVSTIDNPTPASLEADLTHYKVRTPLVHSRLS